MNKRADELFHAFWSKAVNTDGYDKEQWKELQKFIEKAVYAKEEEIPTLLHSGNILLCRTCYDRAESLIR